MGATRCTATRTDGEPCKAPATDDGLCFWHSERYREASKEAARKGGSRRTIELPSRAALTPTKTREIIASMTEAVMDGSLDANTLKSVSYAFMIDRQIRDSAELDARMTELEGQLQSGSVSRLPTGKQVSQKVPRISMADLIAKRDRLIGGAS